jgi:hypothetical protein
MKHIIKASWAVVACCAALIAAASSVRANTSMHGANCKPRNSVEAAKAVYTISESGFSASGTIQVTCPVGATNISHANTKWDMPLERIGAGTVSCTGQILDENGELVATSSNSTNAVGEPVVFATWTNPISSAHTYAFACNLPNAVTKIENINIF